MNPMARTLIYVGVAVVSVSLAVWKGLPSPEINPREFANVGEPFYPEFLNPSDATGIRVVVFNEETAEQKSFEVKNQNGNWLIPSHYNYPADGKEQLAKTAASLVAVKRGVVAGESEADFERLGVVDPVHEDKSKVKGRGERLTLTKGSETLVDLIIGKPVEGQAGHYYVRKPDEKLTFISPLEISLTTKFSDWIEPDLLQVDTTKLRELIIRDYSIDETTRTVDFKGIIELHRPDASARWELEELNPDSEELKTETVNTMVTALKDLKISGVRPKPAGLSSDLKLTGSMSLDPVTQVNLRSKGYVVAQSPGGGIQLLSQKGDLEAVTEEGVAYLLRFGEIFTGNEFDIEVGSAQAETAEKADAETPPASAEPTTPKPGQKQNRYLFVSVRFDEGALGPEPVKPTPPTTPTPPETETPAAPETPAEPTEATTESTEPAAEAPTSETPASETPAEANSSAPNEESTAVDSSEADTPAAESPADQDQQVYEAALKQYEQELAAYEQRKLAGEKRVEELNQRFADWYYVIDASSFDKLHKSRNDLVGPKPKEEPESSENPGLNIPGLNLENLQNMNIPGLNLLPGMQPKAAPEAPVESQPTESATPGESSTPAPTPAKTSPTESTPATPPAAPETPSETSPAESSPGAESPAPNPAPANEPSPAPATEPAAEPANAPESSAPSAEEPNSSEPQENPAN